MAVPTEAASAVKIPVYNPMDPSLWLHMVEATFELATPKPITSSKTKFNHAVAHLPPEVAAIVRDVIIKPSDQPYETLREAILARCGETRTQEIRRLLSGEQLGDRKPSELLRVMQRRAENNNVEEKFLLELFLQQMPLNVQTVLASILPVPIEKAAEVADRILEVTVTQTSTCSVSAPTTDNTLLQEIKELRREVNNLRRARSYSRSRQHRSYSRRRYKSPSATEAGVCWYHRKFKDEAKNCTPPCSFSENLKPQQ